jgi:hypothetical protein
VPGGKTSCGATGRYRFSETWAPGGRALSGCFRFCPMLVLSGGDTGGWCLLSEPNQHTEILTFHIDVHVHMPVHLYVYMSAYLSVHLPTQISTHLLVEKVGLERTNAKVTVYCDRRVACQYYVYKYNRGVHTFLTIHDYTQHATDIYFTVPGARSLTATTAITLCACSRRCFRAPRMCACSNVRAPRIMRRWMHPLEKEEVLRILLTCIEIPCNRSTFRRLPCRIFLR